MAPPLVPAFVQCWPTRLPHSHSAPCCSILTPRCPMTPPSGSPNKVAKVCGPTRKHLPDVERIVLGQSNASTSEIPSTITQPPTARLHSRQVAFISSECDVGLMPDMPVPLTRFGRLAARPVPVPRGQVVKLAWSRLGSSEDAPSGVQALPLPVLRVVGQLPRQHTIARYVPQGFNCVPTFKASQSRASSHPTMTLG